MSEVTRVLKPGGKFLLVDHYAPENPALDAFINDLWLRTGREASVGMICFERLEPGI